jgi:hypothetical protein
LLLSLLQELHRLESCNLAMEEDKAELGRLDRNSATEEEEDDCASLEGWLSETGVRWKWNS